MPVRASLRRRPNRKKGLRDALTRYGTLSQNGYGTPWYAMHDVRGDRGKKAYCLKNDQEMASLFSRDRQGRFRTTVALRLGHSLIILLPNLDAAQSYHMTSDQFL